VLKVTKYCRLRIVSSANFINEIEVNVQPLDVYSVVFGSPYMCMRDTIFMIRANLYHLIKDGKFFIINACSKKSKISLVSAHKANRLLA
jgi:hypothetical protein